MSQLYDQIVSQRGSFERLLARMPGFRGYLDKAARREADRMLRDYVVGRMEQRIRRFNDIERRILDLKDGMSYMSKTSRTKSKMQLYHDKMNAVTPGFSAFMAAVKINADELDKLYSFDEAQIRYVDLFDGGLNDLEGAVKAQAGEEIPAPDVSASKAAAPAGVDSAPESLNAAADAPAPKDAAPAGIDAALESLNAAAEDAIQSLSLRDDVATQIADTVKSKFQ